MSRDRLTGDYATDLATTVQAAGERWNPVVAAHHRVLRVDAAAAGVTVRASGTATGQIIDVLIDNAVVHGAGTIDLTYRQTPGGIAIDVSDDGPGIGIEQSEQIFRRRHGSGHGIGLSLARSLAEADGGRLLLTSHKPTRFTLIIPTTTVGEQTVGEQTVSVQTVGEQAPVGSHRSSPAPRG